MKKKSEPFIGETQEGVQIRVKNGEIFLPDGSFRVLQRTPATKIPVMISTCLRFSCDVRTLDPGNVLVANRNLGLFQVATSLDHADRMFAHMTSGYGWGDVFIENGELQNLAEIIAQGDDLHYLLADWKAMTSKDRETYRHRCKTLVEGLGNPRNDHKIQMRWRLSKASTHKDSMGRDNPGVSRNQLVCAGEEGKKRLAEVRAIAYRIDWRKVVVRREIERNLSLMRDAYSQIHNIRRTIAGKRYRERDVVERLGKVIAVLKDTVDLPWRHAFRHIIDHEVRPAHIHVRNIPNDERERGWALRRLDRSLISLELLEFQRELADFMHAVAIEFGFRPKSERRVKQKQARMQHLLSQLRIMLEGIPVDLDAGAPLPGVDSGFRNEITHRLYKRLQNAVVAWGNKDWKDVKHWLDEAERIF